MVELGRGHAPQSGVVEANGAYEVSRWLLYVTQEIEKIVYKQMLGSSPGREASDEASEQVVCIILLGARRSLQRSRALL